MRTRTTMVVSLMIAALGRTDARAATCAPPTLVAVLDRSSSMNGALGGGSKWTAARGALDRVLATYDRSIAFGLMTFPVPDACGPGRVIVAPGLGRRDAIGQALAAPPPDAGHWTPLGETLFAAATDPAIVLAPPPTYAVVITDGYQWCFPYDPDARTLPIDGVTALHDRGIPTFVVGFGSGVDRPTLAAMAVAGGTARAGCDPAATAGAAPGTPPCYYQADDADALVAALMQIAARAAAEVCDGADNDCDGAIDDGAPCPDGAACRDGACQALPPPQLDAGTGDADLAEDGLPVGGCGCAAGDGPGPRGAGGALGVLAVPLRRRGGRRRRDGRASAQAPRRPPDRVRA